MQSECSKWCISEGNTNLCSLSAVSGVSVKETITRAVLSAVSGVSVKETITHAV